MPLIFPTQQFQDQYNNIKPFFSNKENNLFNKHKSKYILQVVDW